MNTSYTEKQKDIKKLSKKSKHVLSILEMIYFLKDRF
jgi:hypothetical protein